MLDHFGFVDVRWGRQIDVFSGSKHESDAKEFDTRGVTLAARKPLGEARMTDDSLPKADALLEAPGQTCAMLTPLIKGRMRELTTGDVLEVRSDDPAAREGVPAWSRLTGNELIATVEDDELNSRFYLRKK